ncbi:MAG: glycosyltransferase family 4 protein [Methylocystis sp.]|uniref:glycosyltransferase family 4 protein n=1 Tax=Methylocystis sp. TaxID=1911079 RepID=UPI003DA355B8
MRILFFSHYFPPEVNAPASRTFEHCREWVKAGHEVTVVTCAPNHPAGKLYPGYRNRLFQRETIDGVEVVRVWTYLAANEGFLPRILNYVSYMASAMLALPGQKKPDVVVSTSPQLFCGLTGLIAQQAMRAPWVLEIRDIWPESIVAVGAMRKGAAIRLLEALERLAYRRADRIVAVTDSFVDHISARCGVSAKIEVIKNGVDLTLFDVETSAAAEAAKRALGLEGKFVAAYVGTHGMAHGLNTILDAARLTGHDSRIVYLLVGDGAEREGLASRAAELGLGNVRIMGQLPKTDMPTVWAATDVSIIHLKRSDTFKKVLPSKMFEAMAMQRPIILGVEGEAKALLEAAGAGVAITPESADELAAAVTRMADDPVLAKEIGASGAAHVRAHFDRARLAARYVDVLAAAIHAADRAGDASAQKANAP